MQKMRCKGSIFILITVHMRPFKIYYLTYFRTKIQYTGLNKVFGFDSFSKKQHSIFAFVQGYFYFCRQKKINDNENKSQ